MKHYLYYHFPWQFMMIAIFIQSSYPSVDLPDLYINWTDKILHFIGFGILAILIIRSFRRLWVRYYMALTLLVAVLYAATDEIHQYFIPGRDATTGDWLADSSGILIFTLIYYFITRKYKILQQQAGDRK